jgi:tetratricopeptide (TPR) repeat protein
LLRLDLKTAELSTAVNDAPLGALSFMDGILTQSQIVAASLQKHVVALAGRFASLTHDRAIELVQNFSGRFSARVTRDTTLLVVGLNGWPLRSDGRVSRKLARAKRLQQSGHAIEIIREDAFFDRLGLAEVGNSVCRRYTIDQVAKVAGTTVARIKTWLRAGIVEPAGSVHGIPQFDFRQISAVKRLQDLTAAGVTPARLRQSLRQLATWFPEAHDWLPQIELLAEGRTLVARSEDGSLVQVDGQRLLEFVTKDGHDAEAIATLAGRFEPPPPDADSLFQQALEFERQDEFASATDTYRRWLLTFGPDAQVCFNLGNTLFAAARFEAAAERFRQAVEIDPNYIEAWSNLGCALAEASETDEAVAALTRAIELSPCHADAIYNLADILERAGRRREARRHWRTYLKLDQNSPWADHAREQLKR